MNMQLRELTVESGAGRVVPVDLRTCAPGRLRPAIVVCHGFLGYKRWGFFPLLSERLASAGYHVLTMSFSMNGVDERTGLFARPDEFARNTVSREIEDLSAVCEALRRAELLPEGIAAGRWGLFGHSRGGSVAMLAAERLSETRSLVTWSTVGRLDRYTSRRKELWKRDGALVFTDERSATPLRLDYAYYEDIDRHRDAFDLVAAAARIEAPQLLVHGDRDAAVTVREAHGLVEAPRRAAARFEIIRGAGHTFNVKHPMTRSSAALDAAIRATESWFKETLPPTEEENQ